MEQRKNASALQPESVQVVVRCRPHLESEKGSSVVQANTRQKMVALSDRSRNISRTMTFDQVFGMESKQADLYKLVALPLLNDMLNGYNCTMFAYGQTGSGKTYTMIGERRSSSLTWSTDPHSGIIPRCLHEMFERLTERGNEFWVRLSFLELYNEEMFDLLASDVEESKNCVKLYSEKDEKQVTVKGLEEIAVRNETEALNVLERGCQRRAIAATGSNEASSRSHALLTIVLQIKETEADGREVLRSGRLNLIDLAGSENVGRSGATGKRAAEAGTINQSLLTFSRVIQALVERQTHVPYRESKLTRLMADSLGGRSRTCFLATISPDSSNLNETLATLELAVRTRSVQNHPEPNSKTSARSFIKDLSEELERVRRDLDATRSKNGIYVSMEDFQEDRARLTAAETTVRELREALTAKSADCVLMEERVSETQQTMALLSARIDALLADLSAESAQLERARTKLIAKRDEARQQRFLLAKHKQTEGQLLADAKSLLGAADRASAHCESLQNKVTRAREIDATNVANVQALATSFAERETVLNDKVTQHVQTVLTQRQHIDKLISNMLSNARRDLADTAPTCELLQTDCCSHVSAARELGDVFVRRLAMALESDLRAKWDSFEKSQRAALDQLVDATLEPRSNTFINKATGDCADTLARLLNETQQRAALTEQELAQRAEHMRTVRENIELTEQQFAADLNRVCELDRGVQLTVAASRARSDASLAEFDALEQSAEQDRKQLAETETRATQTRNNLFAERARTFRENTSRLNAETSTNLQTALRKLKERVATSFEVMRSAERERDSLLVQDVAQVHAVLASSRSTVDSLCHRLVQFETRVQQPLVNAAKCLTDLRADSDAHTDRLAALVHERADQLRANVRTTHEKLDDVVARKIAKASQLDCVEPEVDATRTQVTNMRLLVDTFAEQQLRTDQPTGATPQREAYTYPRSLRRCLPDEELVAEEEHTRFMLDASNDSILELATERKNAQSAATLGALTARAAADAALELNSDNKLTAERDIDADAETGISSSRSSCDSAAVSDLQSINRDSCASAVENQDDTVTEKTVCANNACATTCEPLKTTAAPTSRRNANPFVKPVGRTAATVRTKLPLSNVVNNIK